MSKGHRSKMKREEKATVAYMKTVEVVPHKWPRYNKVVGNPPGVTQKARPEVAAHEQKLRALARERKEIS